MVDIIRVYYECLHHKYQDKKLEPVLGTIYKAINYYDPVITDITITVDTNTENYLKKKSIINFTKQLFSISNRIVEQNKYQNYDDVLEYLYHTHTTWYRLDESINAIYFPHEYYENDREKYYSLFNDFAHNSRYIDTTNSKYNIRLIEYINVFKSFYTAIPKDINNYNLSTFFEKYGSIIMALFYKDDISIQNLCFAFDYLIDNYSMLYDFIKNNDDGKHQSELEQYLVDRVINNYQTITEKRITN